ncbi:hypothetical protein FIS3754_29770 [Fischerella sp. NIES-3754]|nr:hypothetical protein FIS3754_29770 [Fischerella sp. NIES-3754]BCX09375.1 MAG: hypothetical protein KatS3mg066_3234 [Fischerella sp.]
MLVPPYNHYEKYVLLKQGMLPSDEALRALVSADVQITPKMLQRVIPGWDVEAGVAAARKFLEMPV